MQGYSKYESHELKKQTNKIDIEDEICGFCRIRYSSLRFWKEQSTPVLTSSYMTYPYFIFYLIYTGSPPAFETQWLAVTTHWGATKVPPQNTYPVGDHLSIACHGQAPGCAFSPPTILVVGRKPHSPEGKSLLSVEGLKCMLLRPYYQKRCSIYLS